jgi:PQ loop repeat
MCCCSNFDVYTILCFSSLSALLQLTAIIDCYCFAAYRFSQYLLFMSAFAAIVGVATAALSQYKWYVSGLGVAAVLCESFMGLPQLIKNFQRQSTSGLSTTMVSCWIGGDLMKSAYFIGSDEVPPVFMYGASLQLFIDMFVALQLFVIYPNEGARRLLRRIRDPRRWISNKKAQKT